MIIAGMMGDMPDPRAQEAREFADRIQREFEAHRFEEMRARPASSVWVGLAQRDPSIRDTRSR